MPTKSELFNLSNDALSRIASASSIDKGRAALILAMRFSFLSEKGNHDKFANLGLAQRAQSASEKSTSLQWAKIAQENDYDFDKTDCVHMSKLYEFYENASLIAKYKAKANEKEEQQLRAELERAKAELHNLGISASNEAFKASLVNPTQAWLADFRKDSDASGYRHNSSMFIMNLLRYVFFANTEKSKLKYTSELNSLVMQALNSIAQQTSDLKIIYKLNESEIYKTAFNRLDFATASSKSTNYLLVRTNGTSSQPYHKYKNPGFIFIEILLDKIPSIGCIDILNKCKQFGFSEADMYIQRNKPEPNKPFFAIVIGLQDFDSSIAADGALEHDELGYKQIQDLQSSAELKRLNANGQAGSVNVSSFKTDGSVNVKDVLKGTYFIMNSGNVPNLNSIALSAIDAFSAEISATSTYSEFYLNKKFIDILKTVNGTARNRSTNEMRALANVARCTINIPGELLGEDVKILGVLSTDKDGLPSRYTIQVVSTNDELTISACNLSLPMAPNDWRQQPMLISAPSRSVNSSSVVRIEAPKNANASLIENSLKNMTSLFLDQSTLETFSAGQLIIINQMIASAFQKRISSSSSIASFEQASLNILAEMRKMKGETVRDKEHFKQRLDIHEQYLFNVIKRLNEIGPALAVLSSKIAAMDEIDTIREALASQGYQQALTFFNCFISVMEEEQVVKDVIKRGLFAYDFGRNGLVLDVIVGIANLIPVPGVGLGVALGVNFVKSLISKHETKQLMNESTKYIQCTGTIRDANKLAIAIAIAILKYNGHLISQCSENDVKKLVMTAKKTAVKEIIKLHGKSLTTKVYAEDIAIAILSGKGFKDLGDDDPIIASALKAIGDDGKLLDSRYKPNSTIERDWLSKVLQQHANNELGIPTFEPLPQVAQAKSVLSYSM